MNQSSSTPGPSAPKAAPIIALAVGLIAGLGAAPLSAHDYRAGDLVIAHPWASPPPPGAPAVAGYLEITNEGGVDDRLLGADVTFAERVELHETRIENDVARMRPLSDGVPVPAGETVRLAPNGRHLMFVGPDPLVEGDRVGVTLRFERAGTLEVEFAVEIPDTAVKSGMDHSAHDDMSGHGMK